MQHVLFRIPKGIDVIRVIEWQEYIVNMDQDARREPRDKSAKKVRDVAARPANM